MNHENSAPTATLYTELPYPADGVVRTTTARLLRAGLARHAPHLVGRSGLRIVDVGCGTGEALAGMARFFPQATIVGLDINPPSLAKAQELIERRGLRARLLRADITGNLHQVLVDAGIDPTFDLVVSSGVLHHLSEPAIGFRALRRLIAPGGLFFCYMYSRHGRREEMAVRAFLSDTLPEGAGFAARIAAMRAMAIASRHTPLSMLRTLRQRMRFGPPIAPLEQVQVALHRNHATHASDTYSNPCEHAYSFAELRALAAETGWTAVGLAEGGGLPVSVREHTSNPKKQAYLATLGEDALYDYFAFYYKAQGFNYFLVPTESRPA